MNKDLFGNEIPPDGDDQIEYLKYKDEISLLGRSKRLKYLHKLTPDGTLIMGSSEFALSVREMQWCFIEGFNLSVIVLGQTILEKLLSGYIQKRGASKKQFNGLQAIITFLQEKKLMDEFLIDKLDFVRKIRNPIIHYKGSQYDHSLNNRSFKSMLTPEMQIEADAKKVLEVTTYIAIHWIPQ